LEAHVVHAVGGRGAAASGDPQDRRPALWLTGLTSGLRPGGSPAAIDLPTLYPDGSRRRRRPLGFPADPRSPDVGESRMPPCDPRAK
jgi:hypothetical protein